MHANYDEIVTHGRNRKRSFEAMLVDLLQVEIADKKARSIRYQLTIARMPVIKELAEFDFKSSCVDETLINEFTEGTFLEEQRNVVLIGGTGTGKSHLAMAVARQCIRAVARELVSLTWLIWSISWRLTANSSNTTVLQSVCAVLI